MQPVPADFRHRVRLHLATHRCSQQLTPETDSKHRLTGEHRFADDLQFRRQVRMLRDLVDVHRAAEHDKPVVATVIGLRAGLAAEVHITNAAAGRTQQRVEVAQRFGGHVLEDEQFAHAASLSQQHLDCARPGSVHSGAERTVASAAPRSIDSAVRSRRGTRKE
jgi:hypothetical protein